MLKILYISSLCSEKMLQYIYETSVRKPEQAAQKFHRLLAHGLAMHHKVCKIKTVSTIPVIPSSHHKKFWKPASEYIKKLTYTYIPFINLPYIKNIGIFLYTFIKVFFLTLPLFKNRSIIICDVLNVTVSLASFSATRLTRVTSVALITDLPGLLVTENPENKNLISFFYYTIVSKMIKGFDQYILLTEQMNEIVNPKKKPYLILEGLVDIEMEMTSNKLADKNIKKTLIYAGGLYEKYGVGSLISAFKLLDDQDVELHLYGYGDMAQKMENYIGKDKRIIYKGMLPNKTVVENQLKATLLINPRPTSEAFTKYSFPSKNMEYMVSGTPMVTTKLPGMPDHYLPYIYLFDNETVDGLKATLKNLLDKSAIELHEFGENSKEFVIKNKNNYIQAQRVLKFLKP